MGAEFLDTNILVYAHDTSAGEKRAIAAELVGRLLADGTGCLSVQVLMELAATLTRKIPKPLDPAAAAEIVRDFSTWRVFAPGAEDVVAVAVDDARVAVEVGPLDGRDRRARRPRPFGLLDGRG
jgi:predicted nucleic acid-binding protein